MGAALLSSYYKLCQQPSVSVFSTNMQTFTAVILDLGARFFAQASQRVSTTALRGHGHNFVTKDLVCGDSV